MKVLRKRIIGMILATDMADHMSHVNLLDYKVKHHHITREKHNGSALIDTSDEKEQFKTQ